MEKGGGLNCFSFFLLVLGTIPRVFTLDKRSLSPAHLSFLVKFLILREISLSCPGLARGSHTQDLLALVTRPAALWALEIGQCPAYLPPL